MERDYSKSEVRIQQGSYIKTTEEKFYSYRSKKASGQFAKINKAEDDKPGKPLLEQILTFF